MNKATAAVGLFIGAFLIYFSLFGFAGFGLQFSLTGDFVKEDWNSLDYWQVHTTFQGDVKINPSGQLNLVPKSGLSGRAWIDRNDVAWPSQFTVEWKLAVDEWASDGRVLIQMYSSGYSHCVVIYQNTVAWEVSGRVLTVAVSTDTGWHVWVLTVDEQNGKAQLFRDDSIVASWTQLYVGAAPKTKFLAIGMFEGRESHIDYIYADNGIKPPAIGPEPGYGSIELKAWDGSDYVTASLSVQFPDGSTITVNTPYGNTNAPVGSYTVTCTYQGETRTHTFTLSSEGSESHTFNFGSEPPPNGGFDFLKKIKNILEDRTVKSLMLMVGIGTVGICAIILVMPTKHHPPPPPPRPYYY